jgi:glycosyltransferase involved in cell wall biosynthesis
VDAAEAASVRLVIVGDGPLRNALSAKAQAANANIEFAGFQSGDALFRLVRESRALVIPSEWYENAPISVLEAYACGKPVVGARIGGIPELIEEDETGWLFDSGSVEGLSAALRRVADTPDATISAAGKAARERVERYHTPQHYLDSMRDLYATFWDN